MKAVFFKGCLNCYLMNLDDSCNGDMWCSSGSHKIPENPLIGNLGDHFEQDYSPEWCPLEDFIIPDIAGAKRLIREAWRFLAEEEKHAVMREKGKLEAAQKLWRAMAALDSFSIRIFDHPIDGAPDPKDDFHVVSLVKFAEPLQWLESKSNEIFLVGDFSRISPMAKPVREKMVKVKTYDFTQTEDSEVQENAPK